MEAAYTDAFGRTPGDMVNIATALDGLTLTHGVYNAANLLLNSGQNLTLDCGGDASGVFIFHTAGSLTLGSSAHVNLIGSCQVGNIFWAVAGVTNIGGGVGTESTFRGTVLGGPSTSEISVVTGSTVYGRLLGEKTIALDQNKISITEVVLDTTPPVITRLGSSPVTKEFGSTYTDAGATALDDVDGNITSSIVVVNPVNTSLLGAYTVTYNVSDAAGNPATQVTRTVNVVDTTVPVITRLGLATTSIVVGTAYTDAGATALDDVDGNITDNIVTVDPVNKDVVGAYTVTYNVTDSSGNPAIQKTRTVNVVAEARSSGRGGGGTHYGCKDTNATNYEYFAASNPSLCIYDTTVTAPDITSTTTSVMTVTVPTTIITTVSTPGFPNTGFAPADVSVQGYIFNLIKNICSQRFFQ